MDRIASVSTRVGARAMIDGWRCAMRLVEVARMVGGAVAVYLVMAACSAGSGGTSSNAGGSSSGTASSSSGSSKGDGSGSLIDALTDPVGEAQAGLPPITATEMCGHTYAPSAGTTCFYAEHAFPGYTVAQLAFVVADAHMTATAMANGAGPTGYADSLVTPYVRDGYAAVFCGCTASGFDQVTFYLPQ